MKNEDIVRLFELYAKGELDLNGMEKLNTWRAESTRHENVFQRMTSRTHFEESLSKVGMSDAEMGRQWHLISERATTSPKRIGLRKYMQYATVLSCEQRLHLSDNVCFPAFEENREFAFVVVE